MLFLARHGYGHTIAPHEVNYRANLWALKQTGATSVVSVASVGGIRNDLWPGALLVPHQVIDYTWGRASTYHEGPGTPVNHIDFTEPYSRALRARVLAAAGCRDGKIVTYRVPKEEPPAASAPASANPHAGLDIPAPGAAGAPAASPNMA